MQFILNLLFIRFRIYKYQLLSSCKRVIGKPILSQPLLLSGKGKITFGNNVKIGFDTSKNFYTHYAFFESRNPESEIIIGDNVLINNAMSIEAISKITIGNNVLIGVNCSIFDNDGHNLESNQRLSGVPNFGEILISNNVFIGDDVTILKGVSIGENAVIGAGSVVTRTIKSNSIAVGNPAKIIKEF